MAAVSSVTSSRAAPPEPAPGLPGGNVTAVAARASPVTVRPVSDLDYVRTVLAPRRGRVVLVNFWASYCAPCLQELPELLKLQARVAPAGVDVVFVSVDDPREVDALRSVVVRRGLPAFETFIVKNVEPQPFIDVVDRTWSGEVPFTLVYGRDGALRARLEGEQTPAAFQKAVEEALGRP